MNITLGPFRQGARARLSGTDTSLNIAFCRCSSKDLGIAPWHELPLHHSWARTCWFEQDFVTSHAFSSNLSTILSTKWRARNWRTRTQLLLGYQGVCASFFFLVPGYIALARALSVNRALLTHTRSAARFTMQWQRISTVLADLCRSSRLIPAFKLLLLELSFHCSVPGSFVAFSLVSPLESSALQF